MKLRRILAFVLSVLCVVSCVVLPCTAAESKTPADYVDTLFGTTLSATFAGPALPNGSVSPSPETTPCENGGYIRGNGIVGFGQLYSQGSGGTKSYGNFLLSPQTGSTPATDDAKRISTVSDEKGKAYYYTATLDKYDIKAEIAPHANSAIYRFTFPAGKEASLYLDVSRKIGGSVAMRNGSVTVDGANRTVSGGGTFGDNWNPSEWDMFFSLEYDTDAAVGIYKGNTPSVATTAAVTGEKLGAFINFGTSDTERVVTVKIAVSFESVKKAESLLSAQIPDFDFDAVRSNAKDEWNRVLSAVTLSDTADESTKRRIYTALYHANIQPRNRVSDHGNWDDYYTIWDSWKTAFPLMTLLRPEVVADNLNSFINRANSGDKVMSDAFIQGKEFVCGQGGNDIENIFADACIKNLDGVDWQAAYAAVKADAMNMRTDEYMKYGYCFSSKKSADGRFTYSRRLKPCSATLGFSLNDYAVSVMADSLGYTEDAAYFAERSHNWEKIWNKHKVQGGFAGFPDLRIPVLGFVSPLSPTAVYDILFYEENAWEAICTNFYDLDRIIELCGGTAQFTRRLEYAFDKGYIDFTNEPSFMTPWIFANEKVGKPALASRYADVFLSYFTENDYPGDEDNGAMSSLYIFLMSGFMPFATTNDYYLHGTRLDKITFNLANGKAFTVTGENAGGNNIYVQSATLNGEPLNVAKITYEQITDGGELHFVMGDTPSDWATLQTDENENENDTDNLTLTEKIRNFFTCVFSVFGKIFN